MMANCKVCGDEVAPKEKDAEQVWERLSYTAFWLTFYWTAPVRLCLPFAWGYLAQEPAVLCRSMPTSSGEGYKHIFAT